MNLPSDSQLADYEQNYRNSFADEPLYFASVQEKWDGLMRMVKKDRPDGSIYKKFRNKGLNIK